MDSMATCARCGADGAGMPSVNRHIEYDYCDDCNEMFKDVFDNGVSVRSRHSNRAFEDIPYQVSIGVNGINPTKKHPPNQTEALAEGQKMMERHDLPGVFVYQATGSVWLIDEYLDAHPGIAEDVEKANQGFLSRFF